MHSKSPFSFNTPSEYFDSIFQHAATPTTGSISETQRITTQLPPHSYTTSLCKTMLDEMYTLLRRTSHSFSYDTLSIQFPEQTSIYQKTLPPQMQCCNEKPLFPNHKVFEPILKTIIPLSDLVSKSAAAPRTTPKAPEKLLKIQEMLDNESLIDCIKDYKLGQAIYDQVHLASSTMLENIVDLVSTLPRLPLRFLSCLNINLQTILFPH